MSSYKGNTLEVGERSGLIIGPSGMDYTVTSSNPDTVLAVLYLLNSGHAPAVLRLIHNAGIECHPVTRGGGGATGSNVTMTQIPGGSPTDIAQGNTTGGYTEVTDDLYYSNGSLGTLL